MCDSENLSADGRQQEAESRKQKAVRRHKANTFLGGYSHAPRTSRLKSLSTGVQLGHEIFHLSRSFPVEEKYSLTDQIRRSSRSVAANIAEGFRKRRYPNMLINKLTDCDGEATETQVWLDFAFDCGYLSKQNHDRLISGYEEVGKMLSGMMANVGKFALLT